MTSLSRVDGPPASRETLVISRDAPRAWARQKGEWAEPAQAEISAKRSAGQAGGGRGLWDLRGKPEMGEHLVDDPGILAGGDQGRTNLRPKLRLAGSMSSCDNPLDNLFEFR